MPRTSADTSDSIIGKALSELVRLAMRVEVQENVRLIRYEDRLLTPSRRVASERV
jgi:hypothetical protein